VLVVGNLPYSVGKPILMALVEAGRAIDEMALMLQKEVAERIAAAPGSKVYGALSVLTQIDCDVTTAFTVPPGAFTPPPQVESAVIHLRVRAAPPVPISDPRHFTAVVRAAFSQRRKNLANALAAVSALRSGTRPHDRGDRRHRSRPPRPRPCPSPSSPAWPRPVWLTASSAGHRTDAAQLDLRAGLDSYRRESRSSSRTIPRTSGAL